MGVRRIGYGFFWRDAELYDPDIGVWMYTASMTDSRASPTATLLPNGQVLVAGGFGYGRNTSGDLASAELYDPTTGLWAYTGSMAIGRDSHTATLLANGKVLIAGGYNGFTTLNSAELYDPTTGLWAYTGSMRTTRSGYSATLLPNGQVLVAGGDDDNGDTFASAELYNPATGVWSPTGSMGSPRGGHTATLLANGQVLVVGGYNGLTTLNSAELYDPATGTWSPTGSLGFARSDDTATLLANGKVLIAGGFGTNGELLASSELYDPAPPFINPIFNHPVKLGDGSFQFGFAITSGPGYSVLASPDLAAPLNSWKYLGPATEMPVGSGLFQFTDHQAPNYPQRFYRVSSP